MLLGGQRLDGCTRAELARIRSRTVGFVFQAPVMFAGQKSVTVAPGQSAVSDPVALPFVKAPADPMLRGRKLSVSFHVAGESGPMTWHAKALQTSYLSPPGSGARALFLVLDGFLPPPGEARRDHEWRDLWGLAELATS